MVCGGVHIIFTAVPESWFSCRYNPNHPRPEPPGTTLMEGRSCRAETEEPSAFTAGLTGKLLEVQVSALYWITQFKWISAFNSNCIAVGDKGKSKPCQLPTRSINLLNSTLLQLTQLGGQNLKARALSVPGMSLTVQSGSLWYIFFCCENFASSTKRKYLNNDDI